MKNKVIYKYPVNGNVKEFPAGTVQYFGVDMNDTICVWIKHYTDTQPRLMKLRYCATGEPLEDYEMPVVGRSVVRHGYVWHLVEVLDD